MIYLPNFSALKLMFMRCYCLCYCNSQLQDVVSRAVLLGESNSILIVGPRGCGKSMVINFNFIKYCSKFVLCQVESECTVVTGSSRQFCECQMLALNSHNLDNNDQCVCTITMNTFFRKLLFHSGYIY